MDTEFLKKYKLPSQRVKDYPAAIVALLPIVDCQGPIFLWRVLDCPYCGRQHIHGGGRDGDRRALRKTLGHRCSHCRCSDNPGYILTWHGKIERPKPKPKYRKKRRKK